MKSQFLDLLKKRRSIYALGKDVPLTQEEITSLVKDVVKESPSAFNSQTTRVVFLFNEEHDALWDIVSDTLQEIVPEDSFSKTKEKLNGFKQGYATLLFFEDQDTIKDLQEQFKTYAENFPKWSEQAHGLTMANVWTALAEQNIGANIQHYNPLIDDKVAKKWNIPDSYALKGQFVIGSIQEKAGEKDYISDDKRFTLFS